jgi:hypothetical protein
MVLVRKLHHNNVTMVICFIEWKQFAVATVSTKKQQFSSSYIGKII